MVLRWVRRSSLSLLCKSPSSFLQRTSHLVGLANGACSALHILSAADLGQPSRLTVSGKLTFDTNGDDENEDGNPPRLPIYRDVEATGAGEVGVQSRKTGADSPPGII